MAKKKPEGERKSERDLLRLVGPFALRFFGALFVASLLFSLGGVHKSLEPVQRGLAAAGAFGARLLGTEARADGDRIAVGRELVLLINHECTGVFVLLLWGALLFARRTSWKTRAWSFAAGVLLIQSVNVARLATLAAIAARWPSLFAYFHEYVWQGLFVAMIATMAATWPDDDDVEEQRLVPS
jgi:exosortase/archaeosortase family protein